MVIYAYMYKVNDPFTHYLMYRVHGALVNELELDLSCCWHRDGPPCTGGIPMCAPPKTSVLLLGRFHELLVKYQGFFLVCSHDSTKHYHHLPIILVVTA